MNMITAGQNKTMSSLEIAELSGKNHKDVMRDIRGLIEQGAIGERSFALTSYLSDQNKSLPMFDLDFKATVVLVTGYDAKRRSVVIDRWIKVETGVEAPACQKPKTLISVDKEFRASVRMAKAAGLKGNEAVLSANVLARKITGTDCLELLGATHLIKTDQTLHFTPTEIGAQIGGKSGQFVNKSLVANGLQEKIKTHKKTIYVPTLKGKKFAVLIDTGKKSSDGAMVQQVRWKEGVVQLIREATV